MSQIVTLSTKLAELLGARTADALAKAFGYQRAIDLLMHLPRRYGQRGELTDLAELRTGDHVTVVARVADVTTRQMRNRRGSITEVIVTDGTADLRLTFFRAPWRAKLRKGDVGLFAGKVGSYQGQMQLTHPECFLLPDADSVDAQAFASEIIPVYPATAKVSSWVVAKAIRTVLEQITWSQLSDPLPEALRQRHSLCTLEEAFRRVHRPTDLSEPAAGQQRLRFTEALVVQVVLAQRRLELAASPATPRARRKGGLLTAFDEQLPFAMTSGQQRVCEEIFAELDSQAPMHRLLQGEVGSGKTLVAVRAMLAVVDAGGQAVLLAPTEVLATQHARAIESMLGPASLGGLFSQGMGTKVTLLTGSLPAPAKRQALLDIASGEAGIVIGTHALLANKVTFADLGLVVVDEQHRFGVEQRAALVDKAREGTHPHVLAMTATPIPRTVAMTVFGDLEVSTLRDLPAGRQPIATHVVPVSRANYVDRTYARIREEVAAGRQAYVVCPRIDAKTTDAQLLEQDFDGDVPDASVDSAFEELSTGPLAGLRLAKLHGRMAAEELRATMTAFGLGEIDVLVSTTVIEVGVDVPNATVMAVLDADRFGISQLHQLRGRVGRGQHPGLCLLLTRAEPGSVAAQRLDAVAATTDGFELSRLDLASRREGDVLGSEQSGQRSSLRMLSLLRDEDVILNAREEANRLLDDDPQLRRHPALAELVAEFLDPDAGNWLGRS